ncbi:cytochrome P450 [Sulfitobacter sp. JBTF-M27]|uniref:Cytochrome P450 n=1 Tax=Sulfitobacter sediminilitoris TaxID=2698830 RepID=A0A6P0CKG5_9RHOB|nr:cytochrome P450 [Sulfitobacter sediminilitoris]NEK24944.1 cytochrome P450 [Sulfitobacter sediminilitoris]
METTIGEDGIPFMPIEDYAKLSLEELDTLRKQTPVVRLMPSRVSALRDEDVTRLAAHPSLIQVPGPEFCNIMGIPDGRCRSFLETFMLMTNGDDHKHRRGAFARVFAHPVLRQKRGRVRAVADHIIADLPRGEEFDFLALCASRIPAEMIAEVLGLKTEDSAWFAGHVYRLSNCLVPPYSGHEEVEASAEALYDFVAQTVADRRQAPQDDMISMLVADESDRSLETEELIYQIMGLILGGSDTTRSGFNMIVARLLADRSLWNELQADRSLIPAAIEESLRLEPPVGGMPRYCLEPIEIGGISIPGGQLVGLSTLSAMRDETKISDPETFDLHRKDRPLPHLVFGAGAHRCLGEMLARLEMEEGLAALLDGAPDIEMVKAPEMIGVLGLRKSTPMIVRI